MCSWKNVSLCFRVRCIAPSLLLNRCPSSWIVQDQTRSLWQGVMMIWTSFCQFLASGQLRTVGAAIIVVTYLSWMKDPDIQESWVSVGSHNDFLRSSLPCTEDNKTHWWVGWNQLLPATQGEIREGQWKNERKRKPERHWMKKRNGGDTRCQAVGPRPGCNEDHCPRSARRALLAAPLFDHEPGCSSSSMWKYLVCCRRECLGKEIGRPAFLQPHSPDPPHIPWHSASATAGCFLGGSFLISLSFAQIKWEVNVVLISAFWFKIRHGGITGWMWKSLREKMKPFLYPLLSLCQLFRKAVLPNKDNLPIFQSQTQKSPILALTPRADWDTDIPLGIITLLIKAKQFSASEVSCKCFAPTQKVVQGTGQAKKRCMALSRSQLPEVQEKVATRDSWLPSVTVAHSSRHWP